MRLPPASVATMILTGRFALPHFEMGGIKRIRVLAASLLAACGVLAAGCSGAPPTRPKLFPQYRDFDAIPSAPSHDVFLVKVSYWLPL